MADENNITTLAKRLRPFIKLAAQEMVPVTPYDHGDLTGLASDDHTQYVHNTTARTITAVHTFDPTSATAPFILSPDAQGQTVIGLKADQLAKAVTAGSGLTGGGNLTENITIDINLGSPSGLEISEDKLTLDDGIAGAGLGINNKILAVGQGDGLTVGADAVGLTTPGTLSVSSTNSSSGSHTHAITTSSEPGAAASILATNNSGILTLVTLRTEVLQDRGITGSILINPNGDITLDPGGYDVLPLDNYEINLGTVNKKYLTIHAAELWVETLVAQDTMATIGGRILVAPTTVLSRDLGAANVTIYVKHNQMVTGDIVYLEADGKVEWIEMREDGVLQPEGDYSYSVSRNLDGSGADNWYAGDAVLNTGTTGDGFLDIYSLHSIRSGTQYGPTIVGNIRIGTSYGNLIEGWAIGNLNGLYGYGVDIYGAAFGKYVNSSSFLAIDPTNGIRMIYKNVVGANLTLAQWDISGNLTIGQTGASQDNIYISAGSINFRVNTTTYMSMSSTGVIQIGLSGAGQDNIYLASNEISFRVGTTEYLNVSTAGLITVGLATGPNTVIQSTGITLNLSGTTYIYLTSGGAITIGRVAASQDNILISSGALYIRNNTTNRIELTAAGIMYIRDSAGAAVFTFDASAGAEITKKLTMPGTSSAIAIGTTPPTSATSGTGIWIDRTGLYNLVSSVQNLKIDAATGALYVGAYAISQYPIRMDADGILFKVDGAGDEIATHLEWGSDHTTGLKARIYFYYSGAGVWNQMNIIANPSSNSSGQMNIQGYSIYLQAGTGGITLGAGTGGVKCGPGITIGDDTTAPPAATIQLLDKTSHPTYYSGGNQLYGLEGALIQQNINNRRFNLTGGGGGLACLAPLAYAQPRAVWMINGGTDYDLTYHHTPLSPTSLNASVYKTPQHPGPMYIADFNGSSSYMSAALATYTHLNHINWVTFGAWIYIDTTGRNHAVGCMGTTTQAWNFLWYNPGGYWEFQYYDTGGTLRQIQRTATLTTGWHFIAFEHGWSSSGNNHTLIRYDNTTSTLDNQAWGQMRSGGGDFRIGNANGGYWLDGKIATVWLGGYAPDSAGGILKDYYNLTVGLFN
jgi:hypothetical protein